MDSFVPSRPVGGKTKNYWAREEGKVGRRRQEKKESDLKDSKKRRMWQGEGKV